MDGLDLSAIDQIDQEIFDGSMTISDDGDDELPLPDCIGIDSAVQDDEQRRLEAQQAQSSDHVKSRTMKERELELKLLKRDSIRRQILEKSLIDGEDKPTGSTVTEKENNTKQQGSHVMNITEKAGMSGIDKERINQVIHEASKGSLFYKKQAQRQAEIHKSIEKMLNRVKSATPTQIANAKITCDKLMNDLEKQRVFNKVIVHFDLDMFFAAVEIRDNPELKDKPVAVGGDSMVSTSNYIARRFGVRAAMPGFIARKLCPELLLIKPSGVKYRQASSEVFSILEQYDPELTSMSLDEAYLDLTEYVKNTLERDGLEFQEYYDGTLPRIWWTRAGEIVQEIRSSIFEQTKLTCSAGIACNTLLAKISTDINKPDGQFMVQGYPRDIQDFISKTPVEKVSGIGKVSAQFLNALDIKTCGDIYSKRHFLPLVFYEINVKFYLRVALGDGSTSIKSDEQRKSKSVERTFSAIKDTLMLLDKLDSICEELCNKYLKPYRIRGRTITVKLKRNTFTTTTKSYSMLVPTNDKLVIYSAAKNLLLSEVSNEPPEISYRLLGVKLSNLADDGVTTNQLTIDAMLRNQELSKTTKSACSVHTVDDSDDSVGGGGGGGKMSTTESRLRSEIVTQEDELTSYDEINEREFELDERKSTSDSSTTDGSQKRSRSPEKSIKSFFQKRIKSESSGEKINELKTQDPKYLSQEDDEEFFEALDNGQPPEIDLNLVSQEEQRQNRPNIEDYPCPYCFKPFTDFDTLKSHVEKCYLKIPIDVNKSFFSQKPSISTPENSFFSQQKSSKSTSSKKIVAKQSKITSHLSRNNNPFGQTSSPSTSSSKTSCGGSKMSFYQRFIESNSQSLTQSTKFEPMQCPHCHHGFLSFNLLETHVIMCPKQKSV